MEESRKALALIVVESDLDPSTLAQVRAAQEGRRVLGDGSQKALFDALPGVIARRVSAITPPGFAVAEIEICLRLEGTICGTGLAGEISVTLAPK